MLEEIDLDDDENLRKFNRTPADADGAFEYFLADFIRLKDAKALAAFEKAANKTLRCWFEERTGWRLFLSGIVVGQPGKPEVVNIWRVSKPEDVPEGLTRLGTDQAKPAEFGRLLDHFYSEDHEWTYSTPAYAPEEPLDVGSKPYYVILQQWPNYGDYASYNVDFKTELNDFTAPWRLLQVTRALTGRVNTRIQCWAVFPGNKPNQSNLLKIVRSQAKGAPANHPDGKGVSRRAQRLILLRPTKYDPSVAGNC